MPKSDICRPTDVGAGFTLLEMLVVLALMALALGLVLPRLDVMTEGFAAAGERETMIEAIVSLGLVARADGEQIDFIGDLDRLPGELPAGWVVEVERPIRFHASGACDGGRVLLRKGQREFLYELAAPRCRATLID